MAQVQGYRGGRKMNRYFTSDPHINHPNIIEYCDRPFKHIWNMNAKIIENWNCRVHYKDLVYILGDFYWKDIPNGIPFKELMTRLNGKKILIRGSHDQVPVRYPCLFEEITPQKEIKIDGNHVTLNHYCMRVWPRSHHNAWHLHGHSHCKLEPVGKSLDVGVDGNRFHLWTEQEIIDYMATRPDNSNYVGGK